MTTEHPWDLQTWVHKCSVEGRGEYLKCLTWQYWQTSQPSYCTFGESQLQTLSKESGKTIERSCFVLQVQVVRQCPQRRNHRSSHEVFIGEEPGPRVSAVFWPYYLMVGLAMAWPLFHFRCSGSRRQIGQAHKLVSRRNHVLAGRDHSSLALSTKSSDLGSHGKPSSLQPWKQASLVPV